MDFIVSGATDIGNVKKTNQDSYNVKVISTPMGKMVFAIVCDGMGGLSMGELASATVVHDFNQWVLNRLPLITAEKKINERTIREDWENLIIASNEKISAFGKQQGFAIGTTLTAMLLTQDSLYIVNVGDTRAYQLTDKLVRLTDDQTLVAKEVRDGKITEEEAETDTRRAVLLQGIGVTPHLYPQFFSGSVVKDAVYMLCTDGFRHVVKENEIFAALNPTKMVNAADMTANIKGLINLNKQRQERDNITCAAIRTF